MQNKLFAVMITALLVMLMAGSAMCAQGEYRIDTVNFDEPFIAGDVLNVSVLVCTCEVNESDIDFDNVTVTFNASNFGVDEITLELNGFDDAGAKYIGNFTTTLAQYNCTETVMTDPNGEEDRYERCVEIKSADPHHLTITNWGNDKLLMWEYEYIDIEVFPETPWWDFELYVTALAVYCEDEYGNFIYDMCCDPIVDTTGHASIVHLEPPPWWGLPGTLVVVYNHAAVETCTITARCEYEPMIGEGSYDLEFLEPIINVGMAADDNYLYHCDDCEDFKCDVDCTTVYAQIMDDLGNPIAMPNVPVQFVMHAYNHADIDPIVNYTDENGIVETNLTVCGYDAGELYVYGYAEGRSGFVSIDIIAPWLGGIVIDDPEDMTCGDDGQQLTYTCYTDHGTQMCCPDRCSCPPYNIIWTSDALGDVNETGYFTALDSGTAVVEVNISGVIGTEEIIINCTENCTENPGPCFPYAFVVTSGSVTLSGNFTAEGKACVEAIGDPIPEFDNDTRGAVVDVNETATEDVMLDLAGEGDTWKLNKTTGNWSKYADGAVSEVDSGTYAMVTEPEPEPEPDPTPAATRRHSSGGSGSGTYPSGWGSSTSSNTTQPDNETSVPTPTSTMPPKSPTTPDDNSETNVTDKGKPTPTPIPDTPGFFAVFAIVGVLGIAYLIGRRRE